MMVMEVFLGNREGAMARRVAIGITDFSKLIENNYFYVDKTEFIKEWWENGDEVTLITRPRRFGKTLFMSMVEHFFSVKYAGRSDLFYSLSIWAEETYREMQGTYPVIFLSFADIKEVCFADARKKICQTLLDLYVDNKFLIREGFLEEEDVMFFKRVSRDMDNIDASRAIYYLSKFLSQYYGKKAVILLDEYDTPMQEAYINGYWDELAGFMRLIFGSALKDNPYLERGVMTGITRISKESLFSGLNNLKVVSATSKKYAAAFGFTEDEVIHALEEFGLKDREDEVRYWYDGYRFGGCGSIYNPWSIINFLDEKELLAYWSNTSSNKLVGDLIRNGAVEVKQAVEDLLNGKSIHAAINEDVVFDQLDRDEDAIWGLLLASGYLKVDHYQLGWDNIPEYTLSLVNLEAQQVFAAMAKGWFSKEKKNYNNFVEALLAGDVEGMNLYMNKVALHTFSSFDTGRHPSCEAEPERFYHGFVLGLIVELKGRYVVTSNRESGLGRYDVLLEPLKAGDDGMILEFKVYDDKTERGGGWKLLWMQPSSRSLVRSMLLLWKQKVSAGIRYGCMVLHLKGSGY